MITYDELWRKIKRLRQEVLNLKQVKRVGTTTKFYSYSISEVTSMTVKITYKAGNNPILTDVLGDISGALSSPVNNEQYFFLYTQYYASMMIVSTREILRVEMV